ncbi:LysE family translocator [Halobacteriovorax sp. GB3]|uniref:LysE family translocator n=1 Tax=Halobacteriovorax sp. GB3 TaxID=2719615 RepID=UPI00235DC501|nr:LysE family translocator [Halobacteriovorax sp. GB3]MDD0851857.1 LysE family translocator [Halobacteriovorax sp. GB3]
MNIFSLLGVMALAQFSPGPDMALLLRNVLSQGKGRSLVTVLGIVAGLSIHFSLCSLGLASLLKVNESLFLAIKVIGCLYLIYLGISGLLAKVSQNGQIEEKNQISYMKAFTQGFVCNVLNPKATMFVLSVFTALAGDGLETKTLFFYSGLLLLEALVLWSVFVLFVSRKEVIGKIKKIEAHIAKVLSLILIILGGLGIYEGFF